MALSKVSLQLRSQDPVVAQIHHYSGLYPRHFRHFRAFELINRRFITGIDVSTPLCDSHPWYISDNDLNEVQTYGQGTWSIWAPTASIPDAATTVASIEIVHHLVSRWGSKDKPEVGSINSFLAGGIIPIVRKPFRNLLAPASCVHATACPVQ